KGRGYDGIILQYTAMDGRWTARSLKNPYHHFYIAFEPTQIKSAIGNRGTFDPDDPNILHQAVVHGSPHVFDRFDLSKIGTGEGAQVYGWGLYFAEAPSVAEAYRRKLARTEDRYYVDGEPVDIEVGSGSPDEIALYATKTASTNNLADYIANLREMGRNERADAIEAALAKYAGKRIEIRNEP